VARLADIDFESEDRRRESRFRPCEGRLDVRRHRRVRPRASPPSTCRTAGW
jgi:hypothetical protein